MAYQVIFEKNAGNLQGSLPVVTQGGTLETITVLALYRDGSAVDLSTMTITATATDHDDNVTAISGTLTGANGSFAWTYSAGDVGTAGTYSIVVTYTDGVDSWASDPARFIVLANPSATAVQNAALVGISADEAAWLVVSEAGGPLGTAAYQASTAFDAAGAAAAAVSNHNSDTTAVHGISDTSALETTTGAQTKADAAQAAATALVDDLSGVTDPTEARLNIGAAAIETRIFSDYFVTDRAAGAIDGTATEPADGGYTRDVTDSLSYMTIASNALVWSNGTGGWDDAGILYGLINRADLAYIDFDMLMPAGLGGIGVIGLTTMASLNFPITQFFGMILWPGANRIFYDTAGNYFEAAAYTASQQVTFRIKPETAGYSFYMRGDGYGATFQFLGTWGTDATASFRPILQSHSATMSCRSIIAYATDGTATEYAQGRTEYTADESWGKRFMRYWRAQVAKIDAGTTAQAHIAFMGDSWVLGAVAQLRPQLQALHGNAGTGFVQFGATEEATITRTGTWVNDDQTATSYGVGIQHVISTDAATPAKLSFSVTFINGSIHYIKQTNGGSFRYRVDAGAWQATIDTNAALAFGSVTTGLTGLANASHLVEIEVVTAGAAGVILTGLMTSVTTSGAVISFLGNSGLTAAASVAVNATVWQAGLAAIAPNTIIILLGTNDAAAPVSTSAFAASLTTLIGRIRAALPNADIILLAPADNGAVSTMSLFDGVTRDTSVSQSCGYVSGYRLMPAYAVGNAWGLYLSSTHPNVDGYQVLANGLTQFLNEQ